MTLKSLTISIATMLIISSITFAKAPVVISTDGCFNDNTPKIKLQNSSRISYPILYISGFKIDLDTIAEDFNVTPKIKLKLEELALKYKRTGNERLYLRALKKIVAKRIAKDRCQEENFKDGDYTRKCVGKVLDGTINKRTNRFYPKKMTCLEVIKCNMTKDEKIKFENSKIDEDGNDLAIPKRCRQ